ncbi:unnamed protein product [Adineta steineri]|uniref:Uncharacterized protein n=2 Tax=Adineta steineri TaxID=433720 RepID=A0A814DLA6_9BILA|nr:unnamed protein product [Adineta steineri]CAF3648538.1 unnamed protein product [Adineta steineri]
MCAMNNCDRSQLYHKSIIQKSIDHVGSWHSADSISIDEDSYHTSPSLIDTSKQITQDQPDSTGTLTDCNNKNTSTKDICQTSNVVSQTPRNYQYFSGGGLRLPSPNPGRKATDQQFITTGFQRSYSAGNILNVTLEERLTSDSGRGDSVEHLPAATTTTTVQTPHYVVVPIFGQEGTVALMTNRYDFDQRKIDEYQKQKNKSTLKSWFVKQPPPLLLPPPVTNVTTSKPSRRHKTQSTSILSRIFIKSIKRPPTGPHYFEPIVRHHLSQNTTNDKHLK